MELSEFKKHAERRILEAEAKMPPPVYNIGDSVKTKTCDRSDTYLRRVVGYNKKGIVLTISPVPLVLFENGQDYFVDQAKLRSR